MIRVLNDHSGTRIERATVDGDRVSVDLLREAMTRADWVTHDYNVHFCVGVENAGSTTRQIEISVEGGDWSTLPDISPMLYTAQHGSGPYEPAALDARTDLGKRYCIRTSLAPGARLYIANTLVRSLEDLTDTFEALAAKGGASRCVLGSTLQERDLVAYMYGDPRSKASILVTSGLHPPEPDTLATAEIMDYLATPDAAPLLNTFAVAVIPIANPDGYAIGAQGSNAAAINMYWHFARELPDRCPEAAAIWRFADGLRPRGYIDFHAYTFQLRKRPGPYQRPTFFYNDCTVRLAVRSLYGRMAKDTTSKPVTGFGAFAPHTLGAMLTEAHDTISLAKYHLHLAEGEDGCRRRGLSVFTHLAETLRDHDLTYPPSRRSTNWRTPLRRSLVIWAGLARPNLGWLRRGRFRNIDTTRTGQIDAKTKNGVTA